LSYKQNFILSDTRAQRSFLEKHPEVGLLYKYDDHESLSFVLSFYAKNKNVLEAHQRNARSLAEKELNWETESQKLLSVVASVLSE
jgi:glycosyltransferase involved in cell wall biosynthesis